MTLTLEQLSNPCKPRGRAEAAAWRRAHAEALQAEYMESFSGSCATVRGSFDQLSKDCSASLVRAVSVSETWATGDATDSDDDDVGPDAASRAAPSEQDRAEEKPVRTPGAEEEPVKTPGAEEGRAEEEPVLTPGAEKDRAAEEEPVLTPGAAVEGPVAAGPDRAMNAAAGEPPAPAGGGKRRVADGAEPRKKKKKGSNKLRWLDD